MPDVLLRKPTHPVFPHQSRHQSATVRDVDEREATRNEDALEMKQERAQVLDVLEDVYQHRDVEAVVDLSEGAILDGSTQAMSGLRGHRIEIDAARVETDLGSCLHEVSDMAADVDESLSFGALCDVSSNTRTPLVFGRTDELSLLGGQGVADVVLERVWDWRCSSETTRFALQDRECIVVNTETLIAPGKDSRVTFLAAHARARPRAELSLLNLPLEKVGTRVSRVLHPHV
jgi:hypothetical protein